MFGIICRLCKNDLKETDDKKENYDYKENDNINTKIYPKYLSQETRVNKYFLQLKYNNDNIILYKSNIIDDKETRDRKFNSILLKNIKKYGYQIQKNVYIYENNVYKFTINNNTNLIKDIYNLNIKNILLPKLLYSKKSHQEYLEVFDYYENGDLYSYLFEQNNKISFYDKIAVFKKILNIIIELHKNDYTHRDIKLENFVVEFDSKGEVQPILIDLDFAMKSYQYLHFSGGTAMYLAPEILNKYKSAYSFKSTDIWSLGILFYIMIYSEPLWYCPNKNDNNYSIYSSFKNSNPSESYWNDIVICNNQKHKIPEEQSSKIIDILDYCLDINYMNRIDASVILNILNE